MTGFNHGMTGAVIAVSVKNPALAVPLAFVSHFAQDAIPHFDNFTGPNEKNLLKKPFNIFLICDFIFSVGLMIILGFMFPDKKWLIWGCMVAAASPDLMWGYYRLYIERIKNRKPKYDPVARFHLVMEQSETKLGAIPEVAWFVAMWIIVLIYKS